MNFSAPFLSSIILGLAISPSLPASAQSPASPTVAGAQSPANPIGQATGSPAPDDAQGAPKRGSNPGDLLAGSAEECDRQVYRLTMQHEATVVRLEDVIIHDHGDRSLIQSLSQTEKEELVDMIAQAVIDKIEEREQVSRLSDLVVARVLALQAEEKALESAKRNGS